MRVSCLYYNLCCNLLIIGRSSNGRTEDFGSSNLGSNPSLPAMFRKYNKKIITAILVLIVTVGLIGPGVLLIFGSF